MSHTFRLFMAAALLLASALTAGCIQDDAEIQAELNYERRRAYEDWKRSREQGGTSEAKVDGPLSLDDAVKLALRYNKPLQRSVEERQVTRGERISAWQVITPSMMLDFDAGRRESYTAQQNSLFTYSNSISIQQPVFNGEAIPATIRNARLQTALTDESVRESVQTLISNVANNYYDALLGIKMVETNQEALISAEAQYRMVSEKKKQETATEYDVLRAQVDVANYQARVQSARNDVDTSRVTMLKHMGVSQDSEITFSDELEFLPMRPVLERAVELAFGLRPDIRSANLSARMACEAIKISESFYWPTVAASFSKDFSYQRNGRGGNSYMGNPWFAGLSATYQWGVENFGDLVAAKARARQAQIDILDRQETALAEIRQYMNQLANAEETVRYLEVNQDAAREALRLVEVGYQAGVRTEVDVTDARSALTEVIGQYYEALASHTKARLNLQVAMGVLGPSRVTNGTQMGPTVPIANIEEFAATDYEPPQAPIMPSLNSGSARPRQSRGGVASAAWSQAPTASEFAAGSASAPAQAAPAANQPRRPVAHAAQMNQPRQPAPAAMPAAPAMPVARQAESGLSLPLPGEQYRQPAPVATPMPLPITAQTETMQMPVQAQSQPEPKPMFKVKVREGTQS